MLGELRVNAVRVFRWIVFVLVGGFFFAIALSPEVYSVTSPYELPFHVLLRKIYSVVAFALVGLSWAWAWPGPRGARIRVTALAIAAFSGAIEIGQKITEGHEALVWNAVDVACGGIGGALGALAVRASFGWFRAR